MTRLSLFALLLTGCAMDLMAPQAPSTGSADAAPGELDTDSSRAPEPDAPPDVEVEGPDASEQQMPDPGRVMLMPRGTSWRYLDDGSDQGDAWHAPAFDASAWPSGGSELGYGDGDEVTVIGFGDDPANKFITTYFRHRVDIADPALFVGYKLTVRADDGAVIFLNGTEVARLRLPDGDVTSTTQALDAADEDAYVSFDLPAASIRAGSNLFAIEVHQAGPGSSDVSFDAELDAGVAP